MSLILEDGIGRGDCVVGGAGGDSGENMMMMMSYYKRLILCSQTTNTSPGLQFCLLLQRQPQLPAMKINF